MTSQPFGAENNNLQKQPIWIDPRTMRYALGGKDYAADALAAYKAELVEKLNKMRKTSLKLVDQDTYSEYARWNEAIATCINLIEEGEE